MSSTRGVGTHAPLSILVIIFVPIISPLSFSIVRRGLTSRAATAVASQYSSPLCETPSGVLEEDIASMILLGFAIE